MSVDLQKFKLALMSNSLIESRNIEYINEIKFKIIAIPD